MYSASLTRPWNLRIFSAYRDGEHALIVSVTWSVAVRWLLTKTLSIFRVLTWLISWIRSDRRTSFSSTVLGSTAGCCPVTIVRFSLVHLGRYLTLTPAQWKIYRLHFLIVCFLCFFGEKAAAVTIKNAEPIQRNQMPSNSVQCVRPWKKLWIQF